MQHVLLAGCGNIGFRHLQALTGAAGPLRISVIEPAAPLHPRIEELIATASGGHEITLYKALPSGLDRADLAVIATNAGVRKQVFDAVMAGPGAGVMILEKVLYQTHGEIEATGAALKAAGTTGFVNCGRRYFPGYQQLCARLEGKGPVDVTVTGGNFGLGSNGVHFIDLAEFLNGAALKELDAAALLPGSEPAKREGCVEVFGRLEGRLENGAALSVTCDPGPAAPIAMTLRAPGYHAVIMEAASTIDEGSGAQPFGTIMVSQASQIYEDALKAGTCGLTPYDDSARQHRLFLDALRGHLGLSAENDDRCPVS